MQNKFVFAYYFFEVFWYATIYDQAFAIWSLLEYIGKEAALFEERLRFMNPLFSMLQSIISFI